MTPITPAIKLHTRTEDGGLHINSLIMKHKGNNYHLHGSTGDTIHVFTESLGIYVLTINKAIGYIGLNAYMTPEPDPINSFFLHSFREVDETLGCKWESMKPINIVTKLLDCLI